MPLRDPERMSTVPVRSRERGDQQLEGLADPRVEEINELDLVVDEEAVNCLGRDTKE